MARSKRRHPYGAGLVRDHRGKSRITCGQGCVLFLGGAPALAALPLTSPGIFP